MYVGNRFYNVKKDPYEKNIIPYSEMSKEEKGIRKEFIEVLGSYAYLRN